MSTDFWASYASGAVGVLVGNPLDILKVQLQAGQDTALTPDRPTGQWQRAAYLIRGTAAPVLTSGALNALLFVSYNRVLFFLDPTITDPPTYVPRTSLWNVWTAGAVGGLASWVVSAPTELIKCRAQLSKEQGSWQVIKEVLSQDGPKGLYLGGTVTSIRDSVGYGFYFWAYELGKRYLSKEEDSSASGFEVLLCGGIAGIVTWASIYPLDVIKTRIQSPENAKRQRDLTPGALAVEGEPKQRHLRAVAIAKQAYHKDGVGVFFRGLGVCSLRAFFVNAAQWAVYEWLMIILK